MTHKCTPFDQYWNFGPPEAEESDFLSKLISAMDYPHHLIDHVTVGDRFVVITSGQRTGLSSTLGSKPKDNTDFTLMSDLEGQSLRKGAELLLEGGSLFTSGLGLASLNAGFDPPVCHRNVDALQVISQKGKGKEVALVGRFPFTNQLRSEVDRLFLLELQDVPESIPRQDWPRVLKRAKVVAVTATALLTKSMAYFFREAGEAEIIILGPSTPLTAKFFELGASVLAGSLVVDPKTLLEGIKSGLCYKSLKNDGLVPVVCFSS